MGPPIFLPLPPSRPVPLSGRGCRPDDGFGVTNVAYLAYCFDRTDSGRRRPTAGRPSHFEDAPMNLHISLTSLAVILWSGMLIIAGSIWILSSQVRKLVDLLEEQGKAGIRGARVVRTALGCPPPNLPRENVL